MATNMNSAEELGALSPEEAALVGAFPEDALSEVDAQASMADAHETAAEALGSTQKKE